MFQRLRRLHEIDRKSPEEAMALLGRVKTHISIALGIKALEAGLSTYFISVPELIELITQDTQRSQLAKRMQQMCKPKVLILDEMVICLWNARWRFSCFN